MAAVLIIGGGTAGASLAGSLRRKLDKKHHVILVEKESQLSYQPSYLLLMIGRRQLEDITRTTNRIYANGAKVICGKACQIDTQNRNVSLEDGRTVSYDYLVLAAGVDTTNAGNEKLALSGLNMYTAEGALTIHERIKDFKGGNVIIMAAALPYKCLCAIYEVAFLLDEYFRKKGVREAVNISIYTPEKFPLEEVGLRVGTFLQERLKKKRIDLYTGQHYQDVDPDRRIIHFDSGQVPFDLLIYVPPNYAPDIAKNSGLLDESGWIPVDPFTMETRVDNIYAVGDVNRVVLPSGFDMPKNGAAAHLQALMVSGNLAKKLQGKKPQRFFGGKGAHLIEIGTTGLVFLGDIYQRKPNFFVLPESRLWLLGKWLVEKWWLREHR